MVPSAPILVYRKLLDKSNIQYLLAFIVLYHQKIKKNEQTSFKKKMDWSLWVRSIMANLVPILVKKEIRYAYDDKRIVFKPVLAPSPTALGKKKTFN